MFGVVMEISKETIAKKIREIRKERGISQLELANRLGFSQAYIAMIEKGKRDIDTELLNKIANALGVSVAELLEDHDETNIPTIEKIARKVKLLPIVAAVKAGPPSEPIQFKYSEKVYPYIGKLPCKDEECFVLEVNGDSMSPTLQEGDFILVKRIEKYPMLFPENFENKIVVAANENWEYTIKRLKKTGGKYYLVPDNPKYEIEEPNNWHIVGVALERLPKPEKL